MVLSRLKWHLLVIFAAVAAAGLLAFYSTRPAESAGPFILSGVAESVITTDLGTTATTHANCRFLASTNGSFVASVRGVCYTIPKTTPGGGTPLPPPPPPPPYVNPTVFPNLQQLSGTISQGDGSVTLTFSPSLCLPVDTAVDVDTMPDAGLVVTLDTTGTKTGAFGSGTVTLEYDTGQSGPTFVCAEVDETDTIPFSPSSLPAGHDDDIWGDVPVESAADGCTTAQELGLVAAAGGRRDPFNWWDFFDPDMNGAVAGPDFFALLARFGSSGDPTINPMSAPLPAPAYHTRFDRGPAVSGANGWNLTQANGAVAGTDFFAVLGQFGHVC